MAEARKAEDGRHLGWMLSLAADVSRERAEYKAARKQMAEALTLFLEKGHVAVRLVQSPHAGQWIIGAIIERWPVGADGSYALPGYRAGFSVMLGTQIVCLVWFIIASVRRKQ